MGTDSWAIRLKRTIRADKGHSPGFTLVELFISLLVASVMVVAVYASHDIQQTAYSVQREMARMESNLRAAMYLIQSDLRNAGRGDGMTGEINGMDIIQESRRYSADFNGGNFPMANFDQPNGFQGLTLTMATDQDGDANDGQATPNNTNNNPLAIQTIIYRIWDSNNDGRRELHRMVRDANGANITPGANTLIADGIDAISFAFAYDIAPPPAILGAPKGELDRQACGGALCPIIWAIDDDDTPGLDTSLDNNGTGTIGRFSNANNDDADADGWIRNADGDLNRQIPMKKIRAVKIWILARSVRNYPDFVNSTVYNVGHRIFRPDLEAGLNPAYYDDTTPQFRFLVLEGAVHLRNRERVDVN